MLVCIDCMLLKSVNVSITEGVWTVKERKKAKGGGKGGRKRQCEMGKEKHLFFFVGQCTSSVAPLIACLSVSSCVIVTRRSSPNRQGRGSHGDYYVGDRLTTISVPYPMYFSWLLFLYCYDHDCCYYYYYYVFILYCTPRASITLFCCRGRAIRSTQSVFYRSTRIIPEVLYVN